MKKISVSVPKPCHEKWDSFIPTGQGGFCSSCQKEVIDFTNWSEERLKAYFRNMPIGACGRFRQSQLKEYILAPSGASSSHWLRVALMSAVVLFSTKQAIGQDKEKKTAKTEVVATENNQAQVKSIMDSIKISGIITDETGQPLPGVNVMRNGSDQGTVTNADGQYEILINKPHETDSLVFSFIGFRSDKVKIDILQDKMNINHQMEADVTGMLGGVVIGGMISYHRWSPRSIWWKIKGIFR